MGIENELSERELEILRLVATGARNSDIAAQLYISPNTVKVHLRNIFAKIGVTTRTEATLYMLRTGLMAPASEIPVVQTELVPAPDSLDELPEPKISAVETIGDHPEKQPRRLKLWQWGAGLLVLVLVVAGLLVTALSSGWFAPAAVKATPTSGPQIVRTTLPPRWQSVAPLPEVRSGMAVAAYESNLYLIGGETPQGVTGSALRYRPAEDRWETLAVKPLAVSDVQAVVLGEKIYVPGGRTAQAEPTRVLEVYNPRLNRWEQKAEMPTALWGYALAALEGRLYLFGGWDGTQYSAVVYAYDPNQDSWQKLTPLVSPRGFAAAAAVDGKIILIGGTDGTRPLKAVQVYFPQRDQNGEPPWEDRTPLPEGRFNMGASALADTIYIIGGQGETGAKTALAPLSFQLQSNRWVTLDASKESIGGGVAMLAMETRLHVLGGVNPTGRSALHLTYQAIYTIVIPAVQQTYP